MDKKGEEGEFKDFTTPGKEDKKEYKNKVVFLRKSKGGKHLYAFDNDGAFADAKEGSIIMNIAEVKALIAEQLDYIKVSVLPKKTEED